MLFETLEDFLFVEGAIIIYIDGLEDFLQVTLLIVFGQMGSNECKWCLFEFWISAKTPQITKGLLGALLIDFDLRIIYNPWMLETFLGAYSLTRLIS